MRIACFVRFYLVFAFSFNAIAFAQDGKTDADSTLKLDASSGDFAISSLLLPQTGMLPAELTAEEIQEKLQKTLSPLRAFRVKGAQTQSAIEKLVCIDGTLLDGYTHAPKPMLVRSPDELQIAAHNLQDAMKHLPHGDLNPNDDLDVANKDGVEPREFRRRVANAYLHRGRLLYGLGALDLATADFERVKQWDAERLVAKWLQDCIDDLATDGQPIPDNAERTNLIEQSESEPTAKSLSDLVAFLEQFPNDRQTLSAVCALLDNPNLKFAEFDVLPEEIDERIRQSDQRKALPLALTRLEIECATRLIRLGDAAARRRRARVFVDQVRVPGLAILDTEILVAQPNAAAKDWLLNARSSIAASSSNLQDTHDNYQQAQKACEKALALEPDDFDAMCLQAEIIQLQFGIASSLDRKELAKRFDAKMPVLIEKAGQDPLKRVVVLLLQGIFNEQQAIKLHDSLGPYQVGSDAYQLMKSAQSSFEMARDIATENKLSQESFAAASVLRVKRMIDQDDQLPLPLDTP